MDDVSRMRWRNGDPAERGPRFALLLGGLLLEDLQDLLGIPACLIALVDIEDQQCGEYADADGHADVPDEASVVTGGRR